MGFRSALRHRDFLVLWLAQLVSRIGDSVHEIALIWIVFEVTGDPSLLGLTVAASALPMAVSALPAGGLVDALNRKRVLIAVGLLRAGAVVSIPLVGRGDLLVPVVLGVAVSTGILEAFANPARAALIPNLVPEADLDAANGLFQLTGSLSRMLYVLGGGAVALFGSFAVFYLDAASFVIAAALMTAIPTHAGVPKRDGETGLRPRDVLRDVRSGIGFVRGHRLLPSVLVLSLLTTLAMAPLAVVLPFFIRTIGGDSVTFGLLYGAIYAGIAAGAIGVGAMDRIVATHRGRIVVGGVALVGVALVVTALLPARMPEPLAAALPALVAFGVAFTLVNTPIRAIVQSTVPDDKRGTVFAVLGAMTLPLLPLGALLAGALLEMVAPETLLLAQGLLLVGASIPLSRTPLSGAGRTLKAQ